MAHPTKTRWQVLWSTITSVQVSGLWRTVIGLLSIGWEVPRGVDFRGEDWHLICNVHLFPRPSRRIHGRRLWLWGKADFWYDGTFHEFGAGPLFLICWTER